MAQKITAEEITAVMEKRGVGRKTAEQWLRRQSKKNAAASAPQPLTARTKAKKEHKSDARTMAATIDMVPATLGAGDSLPEAIVTRLWEAGKSLTEIAQKIGTGTRPNGTGFRIGRIRNLLAKAGLYPRKGKK
jgi:hypothetical protein